MWPIYAGVCTTSFNIVPSWLPLISSAPAFTIHSPLQAGINNNLHYKALHTTHLGLERAEEGEEEAHEEVQDVWLGEEGGKEGDGHIHTGRHGLEEQRLGPGSLSAHG